MALQDLTPQLRTRLNRIEHVVGLFVTVATLLLLSGFVYYVYHTAQRKGWFLTKVPYYTYLRTATGLKVGDPVKLMGFDVGDITVITAMPPSEYYHVFIQFRVKSPYYGYVWTDSRVKVEVTVFPGNRYLEIIKGGNSGSSDVAATYREEKNVITGIWDDKLKKITPFTKDSKGYFLVADESSGLVARLDELISQVELALPDVFNLTNQLATVLSNTTAATANLNALLVEARPAVTNLALITSQIRDPKGSLGEWLIPTNINAQLLQTLSAANSALNNTDTNFTALVASLDRSLENLANLTSNLNAQVQANTNLLGGISGAIVHTDELVQGLKRHWLLRSAFRVKTNAPPARPLPAGPGKR